MQIQMAGHLMHVNDKQDVEEEEKVEGNIPKMDAKMDEDLKTIIEYVNKDAVITPEMDGVTEDSKEKEKDGRNLPTDYYGECDSEQDADNSSSCLNGTDSLQCRPSCFFSPTRGFYQILLIAFAILATNATKPGEYAADSGNIQKLFICEQFSTVFINTTGIFEIHSKSRCYCESKKNKCQPGFEEFCLPLITEKHIIAGCINMTTGLCLDGEKCLLVTVVQGYNKYKAECHDKKCPTCTSANSLEERLKMCLFQNEISGDSHSTDCAPETSSTSTGCVQPTYWILCLGIAVVLFVVLTSQ